MERWTKLPHLPGYRVSDHGRIEGKSGRVLKPGTHRDGYLVVRPQVFGQSITCFVHRLVAAAFCEGREGAYEVDHIDGDKTNNHAVNLRWVTRHENMQAAAALGLLKTPDNRGSKNGMAKLTQDKVDRIRELSFRGYTQTDLAQQFDVSRRCIGMIIKGERWAL